MVGGVSLKIFTKRRSCVPSSPERLRAWKQQGGPTMVRAKLRTSTILGLVKGPTGLMTLALLAAWLVVAVPARAQVDKVEPYSAVVTRDGVPLKCRDGSP